MDGRKSRRRRSCKGWKLEGWRGEEGRQALSLSLTSYFCTMYKGRISVFIYIPWYISLFVVIFDNKLYKPMTTMYQYVDKDIYKRS